jgi:hypothetical protein
VAAASIRCSNIYGASTRGVCLAASIAKEPRVQKLTPARELYLSLRIFNS